MDDKALSIKEGVSAGSKPKRHDSNVLDISSFRSCQCRVSDGKKEAAERYFTTLLPLVPMRSKA